MFGNNLERARRLSGMSQAVLGRKIGVTQPVISSWENGKALPNNKQALDLVKILDNDLLLTSYKYTSPIYQYLNEKYFKNIVLGSRKDFQNIASMCGPVLDMIVLYGEILSKATMQDEKFLEDAATLKGMTSRLAVLARILDDIADDFKVR